MGTGKRSLDNNDEDDIGHSTSNQGSHYLTNHPKRNSHYRVHRIGNHNVLPNIVGPWFPRRDGREDTKSYYYAAMLALLKPWRNVQELKDEHQTWESAFYIYMQTASQRDRDVVAGSQYYYESKKVVVNSNENGEVDDKEKVDENGEEDIGDNDHDELQVDSMGENVSI
jgi:hypothetical protein